LMKCLVGQELQVRVVWLLMKVQIGLGMRIWMWVM